MEEGNAAKQGRGVSKQPGPTEALKQMLFRLQAVEAELHRQQLSLVASTATDRLHAEEYPVKRVRAVPLSGQKLVKKEFLKKKRHFRSVHFTFCTMFV